MRRKIKKIFRLFVLAQFIGFSSGFFAATLFAKGEGTTGAVILSQPIGARATGMAEAYTAIEGDICGLHYNPAGLASLKNKQASLLYQKGIADDNFGILAFGSPTRIGTLAASLIYYTAGNIDLIDLSGNLRTVNAQTDLLTTLSFSRGLKNIPLSLGLNTKVLSSTIIEEKATAFAFDFGGLYKLVDVKSSLGKLLDRLKMEKDTSLLYRLLNGKLSFGLVFQNLGTKLEYLREKENLPMMIRTGMVYEQGLAKDHKVLGALDIVKPLDSKLKANLGLEYLFRELIALRAGYKIGYDSDSLTFGLGFMVKNFNIDYGFALMKEVNSTHRLSLSFHF